MIIAGVVAFMFLKRDLFRGVGQCVLSLGFIFLAISIIGDGAHKMTGSPEIVEVFRMLQGHPWVVFLAVMALAVLLQSSTTTIGLGLGLAASGLMSSAGLLPWVLGTNVGLGVTSLLAGWGQIEGRRMGIGNLIVKLVIALPLMLASMLMLRGFNAIPGTLLRQTAMFHTGFNLLVGVLALPFLARIQRLTTFLIPETESEELAARKSLLDENVLETPSLALARATRETLRMADHVRMMLESFWNAFLCGNTELARRIQKEDDVVDRINLDLKNYLCRIVDARSAEDMHWQFTLLSFSNELESIGDLIDKHLCDLLIKQQAEGVKLMQEDQDDLTLAYRSVVTRFEVAEGLLTARSQQEAEAFLAGKESFNHWCRDLQREHYKRLHPMSQSSSAFFLDFLNSLRRVNSHLSSIGYTFRRAATSASSASPDPKS